MTRAGERAFRKESGLDCRAADKFFPDQRRFLSLVTRTSWVSLLISRG